MLLTLEARDDYERKGFLTVKSFFSSEEVSALTSVLRRRLKTPHGIKFSDGLVFVDNLVDSEPMLARLCRRGRLRRLATELLPKTPRIYWSQVICKTSYSEHEMFWHQDRSYIEEPLEAGVTCWIAINEANTSNGCLWLKPGSHQEGLREHVASHGRLAARARVGSVVPVPAEPGDLILLHPLVLHYTGPNRTATERIALVVEYIN